MPSWTGMLKSIARGNTLAALIKPMAFQWQKMHFAKSNKAFQKNNPNAIVPPDQWLFETFQVNYAKYLEDGALCAKEIMAWSSAYLSDQGLTKILDWGCGTGRIAQYIHDYAPYSLVYGIDKNQSFIDWDSKNIKGVLFQQIETDFLPYPKHYFHLVYGISVLTHLPIAQQTHWIEALAQIIEINGILILSTHGRYFEKKLRSQEIQFWNQEGYLEITEGKKGIAYGDRNFSTYQDQDFTKALFEKHFKVLESFAGLDFPEKMGGQDLWILQKK